MKVRSIAFLLSIFCIHVSSGQVKPAVEKKIKEYGEAFFEKDTLHSFKIYFTQCNYIDSLRIYKHVGDSLRNNKYLQANIMVDGKMIFACGIRYKGESSYDFYPGVKKSFRIKFDKFKKGQDYKGLCEINLTNNFKDPTMLREKLYLDILNKNGLPAPRATYAKVYINDKFWGFYLATENIDDVFLERNFHEAKGNLYQGEPLANFVDYGARQDSYYNKYVLKTNTKKNDWSDLVRFIQLINDSSGTEAEYQKRLEAKFSLHQCLKAWAINNLIGNVDAYNMFYPHNFFVYHDTVSSRWHWISLDGNYAFAAWNPILNYDQLIRMNILIPDSVPYRDERPLLTRTLGRNKLIQRQYLLYLRELLNTDFLPENINKMVDSLSAKIRLGVYADSNKMYSNTDFDSNLSSTIGDPTDPGNFIPGIKSYIADRRKNILDQLETLLKKLE
ncbi:MAG: CotH kinase family protein [Bacteroidota bacterium]